MTSTDRADFSLRDTLRRNWGWLLALGIIMSVLGIVGLGMAMALTIVTVIWFGVLMLIGGGAQVVDAFREKTWSGFGLHVVIALLYLVTGALLVLAPGIAAISLTLVLAAALLGIGLVRAYMAFRMRPMRGWGLVLVSGLISAALGVIIFLGLPGSGLWVLGLFVAVELIMQGASCIILALAARNPA
jgi:uncharacterized membrane protein HdeD (DUF308 family)